jgi:futalosine hydrolase
MRILVVAATRSEIDPFIAGLRFESEGDSPVSRYTRGAHQVDVLTAGVGMVATAAWCSRVLATEDYDIALNLGVCGSFDRTLAPGSVVHVVSECLSELGAEDGGAFLTIQELKLLGDDEFPFQGGRMVNAAPPPNTVLRRLPSVDGITVNTVHGNEQSIAAVVQRFRPQVESMEGAAFMYACLIHRLPCAEVRAVSNVVEKRNRSAWKIAEAIYGLGETALNILDHA